MHANRTAGARGRRPSGRRLPALAAVLAILTAGCDNPLNTVDPDIIPPEDLEGPEAIPTIVQGAVGDFSLAFTGDAVPTIGVTMFGGLMSDEFIHSGTFPSRAELETRTLDIRNPELTILFRNLQRARRAAERAVTFIDANAADPSSASSLALKARMHNLAGYMYALIGEHFCSGVPFSQANEDGTIDFGQPLTTTEIYGVALDRFASAADAATAAGSGREEIISALGTARVLQDMGDFAAAGASAAAVPSDFRFELEHSINSTGQENGIFFVNAVNERWSLADAEGGNGLSFRGPGGALDIRIPWVRTGGNDVGFDRATPQFDLLKYPGRDKLSVVGSGIEARLIEAEAALQAGDPGTWLQILNDLRADVANLLTRDHQDALRDQLGIEGAAVALDPLTDPGTLASRVDLHFAERAFWLFATASRMSDMRRLIRQYGRDAETVFPTGGYFKGGVYGTDVTFPVVLDEENNPNFDACLNRDA